MVAILGIVVSVVLSAVTTIGKCVASPLKRQFTYLCCFNKNIQSLSDETRNLEIERDGLQREVHRAENNAELIVPVVTTWLEDVNNKIQVDKHGIDDEIRAMKNDCWGIKSRYRISRKAVKITEEMKQLVDRRRFNHISTPPPCTAYVPVLIGETYEFQSQKQIEEEIMEALRANEIRTMGICGMGGMGKTTMAKRIMNRVRDENIFQEICIVVFGQQVDMSKKQVDIAESFGLELKETSLSARANKLRARLTGANSKRTLIVLDDVWEKLKFDELGIPCGNECCTVLLTSRNRDVLNRMDVQKICAMEILSEAEAWFLFREKAGTCVDDKNLCSIAKSVAKECKGLLIALITVGGASKNKTTITFWEDALQQLKSSSPVDMPDVIKHVYNPLKLSYAYLESWHAKLLLLLCSLFPEDDDISLEDLALYCMGLRMFGDLDYSNRSERTLKKVRNRVFTIVDQLKNCFLLLDGKDEHHVRMHDVVRDVAIHIATKEVAVDDKFNSIRSSSDYTYERISVPLEEGVSNIKKGRLLRMHGLDKEKRFENKDSSLFEKIEELNVLSFKYISLKSLPLEIQSLNNLRTLLLQSCDLGFLYVVRAILNLEILHCHDCSGIVELPVEIGNLNQLKVLDFSYCRSLETIPPGVISNLKELEEFKMLGSFGGWESAAAVQGQERRNASLNEFENLSKLICLEIQINDFKLAAEEIRFSPNIVNYNIRIGVMHVPYYRPPYGSSREIRGMFMNFRSKIKLGSWVLRFLRESNDLHLQGDGSDSLDLPHNLDPSQAHNMKSLRFENWSTVKRLVNPTSIESFPILESLSLSYLPNLEEIFDGQDLDESNSFQNLQRLYLAHMPALKHLCKRPNRSVSLDNLRSIEIRKCNNLVNLFSFTMDGQNPNASTSRHVDDLLRIQETNVEGDQVLEFFYTEAHFPTSCRPEIWPIPINSTRRLRQLWTPKNPIDDLLCIQKAHFPTSCRPEIWPIPINSTRRMRQLWTPKNPIDDLLCIQKAHFPMLEKLELVELDNLEVIWNAPIPEGFNSFNNLKELSLSYLPAITHLWKNPNRNISLRNLSEIHVSECHKLRSLFSSTVSMDFVLQLNWLEIDHCHKMEQIILLDEKKENDTDQHHGIIQFPKLSKLKLFYLKSLTTFSKGIQNIEFPMLVSMHISGSPDLKSLISSTGNNQDSAEGRDDTSDLFFGEKAYYPKLTYLELQGLSKLEVIWNTSIPEGSNSFNNLKKLELSHLPAMTHLWKSSSRNVSLSNLSEIYVCECHKLRNLFSSMSMDFVLQLERLDIKSCKMMEQVMLLDGENEIDTNQCSTIQFSKLSNLTLHSLESLTTFSKGIESIEFPILVGMSIKECPKLTSFLSSTGNNQDSAEGHDDTSDLFFGEKAYYPKLTYLALQGLSKLEVIWNASIPEGSNSFNNLKKLELSHLPAMTHLWKSSSRNVSLSNLSEIYVYECHKLRNLFSSMSMDFVLQLERLDIKSCKMMEQVMSLDGENEIDTNQCSTIQFSKLSNLTLHSLESLTTFSKGIESIEFPILVGVSIKECPKLTSFLSSTGNNQDSAEGHDDTSDLFFGEKAYYPKLTYLALQGLSKLEVIWNASIPEGSNSFNNLKKLELSHLPAMTHLWKSSSRNVSLSNLSEIYVCECHKLRNLFSSMSMDFVLQLERLDIKSCKMMEQVMLLDGENEIDTNQCSTIQFSKLSNLTLHSLESLTTFSKGIESIEFPILVSVSIKECPKLTRFLSSIGNNQDSA